jgi:hypothetical protein
VSLKNEIESNLSFTPKMSMAMGELRVLLDGKQIFSYKQQKRMPRPGEILGMIESRKPTT